MTLSPHTPLYSACDQPSSSLSRKKIDGFCFTTPPTVTSYTTLGSLMQCYPQMNPFYPTHAANASSSLQHPAVLAATSTQAAAQAATAALSLSTSLSHSLLAELSRKPPVLDPDTKFYLTVLLCIAAANSAFTFVRAFSFAYGGLAAARKLHDQLLTAVISAPAKFFQTTLPGRELSMAGNINYACDCVYVSHMYADPFTYIVVSNITHHAIGVWLVQVEKARAD